MSGHFHANARDASDAHGFYTTSSTRYYVTFQLASGDRVEFQVDGPTYGMLAANSKKIFTKALDKQ